MTRQGVGSIFERAVLFDSSDKYMVDASRREIVYVLEGSATLVTGGTAVEPKTIAPGEVRESHIAGGDVRQIAKGDVIVIPAGTPHWFREVSNPLLYYVVKAR